MEQERHSSFREELNDGIRIGSKGGFLLIVALLIAAAAFLTWGFVGRIPITVTEPVVIAGEEDETNICVGFIGIERNTGIIPAGSEVNLHMPDGKYVKGTISTMPAEPLTSDELRSMFGITLTEWMKEILIGESTYSYMFFVTTQEDVSAYWHQIADASFKTGEVKPISLLIR